MRPVAFKGNTEFDILYFNDVHSKTEHFRRFKTAVDEFDSRNKGKRNLKLAGGDLNMDIALKPNVLILKLMDLIGLDASSVGNHDMEGGSYWAKALEKAKPRFKFLAANLNFSRPNKLESKIAKSMVIERQGEKVGVIGVSPIDYEKIAHITPFNDFMTVKNIDETVKSVEQEVKKLEQQGINKIFLLAHTGKEAKDGSQCYEKLARIGGIDVIVGGHDHKEFDAWFKSERGEPVKVVSAGAADDKDIVGQDLDSFGELKAVFNDNGVLIPNKCQNQIKITGDYPVSQEVVDLENEYLQLNKVISSTNRALTCKSRVTQENPVASLAADAALWLVNRETKGQKAQIAFVNSGTVRGDIPQGKITIGAIQQALPFVSSTLIKTTLTKKQIIDTLNWGIESTTLSKISPGLMQVGGMRYTIGKDNKVKDVYLVNQDGSLGEKLDDAPDNRKYTVIYDDFLMTGVAGLSELKKNPKDKNVEYFPYNRQDAVIQYLQKNFSDKPVEVRGNRIEKNHNPSAISSSFITLEPLKSTT